MASNNNIKALKSGVWYTAANFVMKSLGFITTPIFTRLLSHNDYGLYSNYASWLRVFTVFATMNLGVSFISAKFDYEKDFDGYVSSVLVLSSSLTAFWGVIINLFPGFFSSLTGVEPRYLNVMVVYLLTYAAVDMFQIRERYDYEYKISAATSLLTAISTVALSVALAANLDDKLSGRIIGSAVPTICIGAVLYGGLMWRGKKVSVAYWKYALPICAPYMPHILSLSLLNSMDKMMITKLCGPEENALYSVAYSCGAVVTLLVTSLNTAFSPWLGEKLHTKRYDEIRNVSKPYILLFIYAACGVMLLTPELLLVMGGRGYAGSVYVMPPVTFGCVCQFLYTLYVNVEQFRKKTVGMAFASVMAAASNFVLNGLFIPRFGYLAAAYTTLASYVILLFIHMLLVRRMGLLRVYPTRLIFAVLLFMSGYTLAVYALYLNVFVRYGLIAAYAAASVYIVAKYREFILKIIRK